MIFPFFRCISTFCFLHGTLLFGLSVIKKGNSVSLSPIKCMYWFYVTIFSISSLYYDVGVKSFWPLWYRIALHCVLPQFSKTFVIRSFFFEKWLLTHVFGGSQGQKFSCKQACVKLSDLLPLVSWYPRPVIVGSICLRRSFRFFSTGNSVNQWLQVCACFHAHGSDHRCQKIDL